MTSIGSNPATNTVTTKFLAALPPGVVVTPGAFDDRIGQTVPVDVEGVHICDGMITGVEITADGPLFTIECPDSELLQRTLNPGRISPI